MNFISSALSYNTSQIVSFPWNFGARYIVGGSYHAISFPNPALYFPGANSLPDQDFSDIVDVRPFTRPRDRDEGRERARAEIGGSWRDKAYREAGSRSPGAVTSGADDGGLIDVAGANKAICRRLRLSSSCPCPFPYTGGSPHSWGRSRTAIRRRQSHP